MESRKTKVISFDFDGCLFNLNYINLLNANDNSSTIQGNHDILLEANQQLIDDIIKDIQENQYEQITLMVGSNRQDLKLEFCNMNSKGVCYPALLHIAELLRNRLPGVKIEVDKFLMADAYHNLKPGTTFDAAIAFYDHFDSKYCPPNERKANQPDLQANIHEQVFNGSQEIVVDNVTYPAKQWAFDKHKISLLYAQMHRAASTAANTKIVFDFFDDKSDIHHAIIVFFKDHPDMRLPNVTLRLFSYTGGKPVLIDTIEPNPENKIDYNYFANVKLLYSMAGYAEDMIQPREHHIGTQLLHNNRRNLNRFVNARDLQIPNDEAMQPPQHCDDRHLVNNIFADKHRLREHIIEFKNNNDLESNSYARAFSDSLDQLYQELSANIKKQNARHVPFDKLNQSTAAKLIRETNQLLIDLPGITNIEAKQARINQYEVNCHKIPGHRIFYKILTIVAIAALGFIIGASLGFGICMMVGSLASTGSTIATGMAASMAGGGTLIGGSTATAAGILLFKPRRTDELTSRVAQYAMVTRHSA